MTEGDTEADAADTALDRRCPGAMQLPLTGAAETARMKGHAAATPAETTRVQRALVNVSFPLLILQPSHIFPFPSNIPNNPYFLILLTFIPSVFLPFLPFFSPLLNLNLFPPFLSFTFFSSFIPSFPSSSPPSNANLRLPTKL